MENYTQIKGIFASVPYCTQLLEGPYVETRPEIIPSFRPNSAIRVAVDDSGLLINTDAKA